MGSRVDVAFPEPLDPEYQDGSVNNYLVRTAGGVLYHVYINFNFLDVYYVKSTNNGLTWQKPVLIYTGSATNVAVWYDRWTTGTGDLIHISWLESGTDIVHYRSLDTTSDTLGTDTTVFDGTDSTGGANTCLSIVKAIGGNLYVAFDMRSGAETGFYRSTDAGANWTARTDLNEAVSDYYKLVPGFAADTQDIMAIFWDRSALEISRKIYDDSANTWAETSIATSMTTPAQSTTGPNFGVATDLTNSRILLCAWSATDLANADLRFWTVTESAITESATNVVLDSVDDQTCCCVALETDTAKIYVFYFGKSDGSETYGGFGTGALNVYYKTSTDVGATWSAETKLNTSSALPYLYMNVTPRFLAEEFGVFSLYDEQGFQRAFVNCPLQTAVFGSALEFASGQEKTTSTSFSVNSTLHAAIGQLIIVVVATDNEGTSNAETNLHTACTVGGQGCTKAKEYTIGEGAANAGATVSVWFLHVTTAISNGSAVATTLNSGRDAKAMIAQVLDADSTYSFSVDGTNTLANSAADPGSLTATGVLNVKHVWVRGIAAETASTVALIPTAGWTALTKNQTSGGADNTNMAVRAEFKVSNGTSSGASDPTYATADCASVVVGIAASIPGGNSVPMPPGTFVRNIGTY